MKRLLLLALLIMMAPSSIDQLDADFQAGLTQTNINATNNTVILTGSPGSYSASGTYESTAKDLGSRPTVTIGWTATTPTGTSLLVYSRSGAIATPDGTWTAWAGPYMSSAGSLVTAQENRYHQYRLQLATTDNTQTPTVQAVTLTYTEQGPIVTVAASQNAALTETTTGTYRFHVSVNDTMTPTTINARYRIGSDAYTTYQSMTTSGAYHYIDIAAPTGGWVARQGEMLSVNVYAENANTLSDNETFTDVIDDFNIAPVLQPVQNTTATENVLKRIFISGYDDDGDAITFTSSRGTIQTISSTSAYILWTPNNLEIGNVTINITVSDGTDNDSQQITVDVTDVNSPPYMRAVTGKSGHYGDRIVFDITVEDNDTGENLSYWVDPPLFPIETLGNSSTNTYYARANFTALDNHRGNQTITFWVGDGEANSSATTTLSITHCGDNVCQTQENSTSCRQDCAALTTVKYVAIEVPDRICQNETFAIQAFEASSRYTCHYEGKTFNDASYCSELDATTITIYSMNGSSRTQKASLTTNATGHAVYTSPIEGVFKLIAEKESYVGSSQIITIKDCANDISNEKNIINFPKPDITAQERDKEIPPALERPSITPEEMSIVAIIIWYLMIPLLLAGLLYAGNAYYDLNKDTDPRLLKMRLAAWKWRLILEPKIMPPLKKAWTFIGPYVAPPARLVWKHALSPVWDVIRGPLIKAGQKLLALINR